MVAATVSANRGRAIVYAGIASNCFRESIDAANEYKEMGVDCVVALDIHNEAAFDNAFRCQAVRLEAGETLGDMPDPPTAFQYAFRLWASYGPDEDDPEQSDTDQQEQVFGELDHHLALRIVVRLRRLHLEHEADWRTALPVLHAGRVTPPTPSLQELGIRLPLYPTTPNIQSINVEGYPIR